MIYLLNTTSLENIIPNCSLVHQSFLIFLYLEGHSTEKIHIISNISWYRFATDLFFIQMKVVQLILRHCEGYG